MGDLPETRDKAATPPHAPTRDAFLGGRVLVLQPARGAFVSHEGKVVLALDHYCFWLGTTIGLRNRKYFLLFLLYSCALALWLGLGLGFRLALTLPLTRNRCALALLAGGHALHELLVGLPARLPASVVGVEGDVLWQRVLGGEGAGPRLWDI